MSGANHPAPLTGIGELRLPCRGCGTNLRSVSLRGTCPGCGMPVSRSVRIADPEPRAPVAPAPCASCGYDLRGLESDRCPECGSRVSRPSRTKAVLPGTALRIGAQRLVRAESCPCCGVDVRSVRGERCPSCDSSIVVPDDPDRPLSEMPLTFVRALGRRIMFGTLAIALGWAASLVLFGVEMARHALDASTPTMATSIQSIWIFGPLLAVLSAPVAPLTAFGLAGAGSLATGLAIGAWLLTPVLRVPEALRNEVGWSSGPRRAARAFVGLWALAALSSFVVAATAAHPGIGRNIALCILAPALLGLTPLAIHMRRLAAWMRDDWSEPLLSWATLGAPAVAALPIVAIGLPQFLGVQLLLVPVVLAAIVGFYGLMVALSSMPLTAHNLIVHAVEHVDRLDRRLDRDEARARELLGGVMRSDPSGRPPEGRGRPAPPRGDPFDAVR
ncbi:MAG TPA: hypothetical protein PKC43_14720 [Phycisphaerales bacterium]|nr:hypothetical protein [Phycisphaerales bacterium]HMP38688.1 hypothetical protein [Phycisphaerales bacterium]